MALHKQSRNKLEALIDVSKCTVDMSVDMRFQLHAKFCFGLQTMIGGFAIGCETFEEMTKWIILLDPTYNMSDILSDFQSTSLDS